MNATHEKTAFKSSRAAKEYLASRIVDQAEREGSPLPDVERKMLFFSETHESLPNMPAIWEEFSADYDQDEYETKISKLIKRAYQHDSKNTHAERSRWFEAIRRLKREDHYILVMIRQADIRPPLDALKLFFAAIAVILVFMACAMAISWLGEHVHIDLSRHSQLLERLGMILWLSALTFSLGGWLLATLVGAQRWNRFVARVVGLFTRRP